jgi:hypothetical protein
MWTQMFVLCGNRPDDFYSTEVFLLTSPQLYVFWMIIKLLHNIKNVERVRVEPSANLGVCAEREASAQAVARGERAQRQRR